MDVRANPCLPAVAIRVAITIFVYFDKTGTLVAKSTSQIYGVQMGAEAPFSTEFPSLIFISSRADSREDVNGSA